MRQAIQTKYIGPTDHRSARIRVTADAGSLTVPWDYDLGVEDNHRAAAKQFAEKYEWWGRWVSGGIANGYVFVQDVGTPYAWVAESSKPPRTIIVSATICAALYVGDALNTQDQRRARESFALDCQEKVII